VRRKITKEKNMGQIILVTGGCRSGKSDFAQKLAESLPGSRLYVATCPVIDDEMAARVARHRQSRAGRDWETAEASTELTAAIGAAKDYRVILIDCLTIWTSNLLWAVEQEEREFDEEEIVEVTETVLAAARRHNGNLIFVTNEVGMGIVPENSLGRKFRDLAGRVNQVCAAEADRVIFLVSGIPWTLKGT